MSAQKVLANRERRVDEIDEQIAALQAERELALTERDAAAAALSERSDDGKR